MKKITSCLLIIILAFSFVSYVAFAWTDGTCGEGLDWEFDGDTLTISGNGEMTDFLLPSSMKSDLPDAPWYAYGSEIKYVVIEEGVTSIGNSAFSRCENLIEVSLPDGMNKIGEFAFYHCDNLKEIEMPDSITYIGNQAFTYCQSMESIKLSDNITDIGIMTFGHCYALTDVTIPDGVETIDEYAFFRCKNLNTITIPKSVKVIHDDAFFECDNLINKIMVDSVSTSNEIDNYNIDIIDTVVRKYTSLSNGGKSSVMTATKALERWASPITSYVFNNMDDTFDVLNVSGKKITVDRYSKGNYELSSSKEIPFELNIFGGFCFGESYNWIVFGQSNDSENDDYEVIRVVKYSKDFERLGSVCVKDCYTVIPFKASTVRMDEENDKLIIHTSRQRYTTEDGLRHQSQLSIEIDIDEMCVLNDLGEFQDNHVSHSFNQFVKYDGGKAVFVDHGDGYPRAVAIHQYDQEQSTYFELELFRIPGETGANCTGITIGGFEVSENNYLVTINSIDHNKADAYTSHAIIGLDLDERDVVLLVHPKNKKTTTHTKQIKFTNYVDKQKLASTPYLVKINDEKFVVLWEEYEVQNEWKSNGVKYICVDGDGNAVSQVYYDRTAHLSKDCQPYVMDGRILWYVNENAETRTFYEIDVPISVLIDGNEVKFDQIPVIQNNRTLVPIRAIFEAMGYTVDWDDTTQTATSVKGNDKIVVQLNNNIIRYTVNGKTDEYVCDVLPQIVSGRTLVPARAVAESAGCIVDWDGSLNKVIISTK